MSEVALPQPVTPVRVGLRCSPGEGPPKEQSLPVAIASLWAEWGRVRAVAQRVGCGGGRQGLYVFPVDLWCAQP